MPAVSETKRLPISSLRQHLFSTSCGEHQPLKEILLIAEILLQIARRRRQLDEEAGDVLVAQQPGEVAAVVEHIVQQQVAFIEDIAQRATDCRGHVGDIFPEHHDGDGFLALKMIGEEP